MTLTYRTEYRLGRLGGRVERTYGGFHALVAIVADRLIALIFGAVNLSIGLVVWALRLAWRSARFATLTFRAVVAAFARGIHAAFRPAPSKLKPAWSGFDEL